MVSEMTFDLTIDGNKVTGMVHMSYWPGDASIMDGKVEGDRITFTLVGKSPWTTNTRGVTTSGYPKLVFDGHLKDSQIDLKLNWGNVLTTGEEQKGRDLDMLARKISD